LLLFAALLTMLLSPSLIESTVHSCTACSGVMVIVVVVVVAGEAAAPTSLLLFDEFDEETSLFFFALQGTHRNIL
jgi:hypothetical protein